MDSIMKFVLMNGETENIKDVYTGDSIPPFYKEAFDEFSQYKFVGVVSVSPADLLNVKGIDNELDMEQVRDSRDVSEELISKLNTKGFDGARLILTEKINGKYVVLSGHSRLKYSIEKYKQILIYVVESTESDYDVNNTLDLQAALNAENDVADKVTVENIINIAHVKMNRNLGRKQLIGGCVVLEHTSNTKVLMEAKAVWLEYIKILLVHSVPEHQKKLVLPLCREKINEIVLRECKTKHQMGTHGSVWMFLVEQLPTRRLSLVE